MMNTKVNTIKNNNMRNTKIGFILLTLLALLFSAIMYNPNDVNYLKLILFGYLSAIMFLITLFWLILFIKLVNSSINDI